MYLRKKCNVRKYQVILKENTPFLAHNKSSKSEDITKRGQLSNVRNGLRFK